MKAWQGISITIVVVLALVVILSTMSLYIENHNGSTEAEEPIDEVIADDYIGEEPRDENLSESGIVMVHGDCFGAVYPLRNGDVLKFSDDYELTVRHVDGTNQEIWIEFLENGEVIDNENLTGSSQDSPWMVCVFQENE